MRVTKLGAPVGKSSRLSSRKAATRKTSRAWSWTGSMFLVDLSQKHNHNSESWLFSNFDEGVFEVQARGASVDRNKRLPWNVSSKYTFLFITPVSRSLGCIYLLCIFRHLDWRHAGTELTSAWWPCCHSLTWPAADTVWLFDENPGIGGDLGQILIITKRWAVVEFHVAGCGGKILQTSKGFSGCHWSLLVQKCYTALRITRHTYW